MKYAKGDLVLVFVVDDFLLLVVLVLLLIIVVLIIIVASGDSGELAMLLGEILKCYVAILELQGHGAFGLHHSGRRDAAGLLALERNDYALPGCYVIEIHETDYPFGYSPGYRYGIHGAAAKVLKGVPCNHGPLPVEGLEQDRLVDGEFEIGAELLVEGVQGVAAIHLVHSVETFYPLQGNPIRVNHNSFFTNQHAKIQKNLQF